MRACVCACVCVWGQYADNGEFMWRLARAYSDMCETADNREEKRNYAEQGEEISHECSTNTLIMH